MPVERHPDPNDPTHPHRGGVIISIRRSPVSPMEDVPAPSIPKPSKAEKPKPRDDSGGAQPSTDI